LKRSAWRFVAWRWPFQGWPRTVAALKPITPPEHPMNTTTITTTQRCTALAFAAVLTLTTLLSINGLAQKGDAQTLWAQRTAAAAKTA
jgi:hypothetical protein